MITFQEASRVLDLSGIYRMASTQNSKQLTTHFNNHHLPSTKCWRQQQVLYQQVAEDIITSEECIKHMTHMKLRTKKFENLLNNLRVTRATSTAILRAVSGGNLVKSPTSPEEIDCVRQAMNA